jgi:2-polyprenyl-3-methyl-5-hydroxy-6-metoxy-1,4-benzoquinol methylase
MKQLDFSEERTFLDSLAGQYRDQTPYSTIKKELIAGLILERMENSGRKSGLQLGCSNGYETALLADHLAALDVLDGSSVFIGRARQQETRPHVTFHLSLFEEFSLPEGRQPYDYIFCNYILEHVYDARAVLERMRGMLRPGGTLFAVVPNAYAFSRQLAREMNLVGNLKSLTENDLRHGHRRVYDRESLLADFAAGGFEVTECRGIVFKILADFQLNSLLGSGILTKEHISGLFRMGLDRPDFSDSLFITAQDAGGR